MSTPHNKAEKGEVAKVVIMPGDPKRAKYISENFLENANMINDIRSVSGYTGLWKGVPITVMASGMGIPSMSIYSWELFDSYDVDAIIRIGTAGAYQDNINLGDIVIAQATCTNSNYIKGFNLPGNFAPIADYELLSMAVDTAKSHNKTVRVGNLLSSDFFYLSKERINERDQWKDMGVLAAEMEAAGLYTNAAYFKKKALAMCSISDHMYREEIMPPEVRERGLNDLITIALDTAVRFLESKN